MSLPPARTITLAFLPALLVAILFQVSLGHRSDYLGHYAAGYGATLLGLTTCLVVVPATTRASLRGWIIVAGVFFCIGLGFGTEATVFRLAKFDEVDFCNQSLGAALAGATTLRCFDRDRSPVLVGASLTYGFFFLTGGFYFAFA